MIRPIIFGKFILLERVSVGGMAEVFRAKLLDAPQFERFFAIKRILPNLAVDAEFINMFIDEAKITVELDHPNVCQIYELGRLGQSHYIAMEYIPGRDVLAIQNTYRRQKKIMSVSQACFITMQVAQGLDYAHRAVDSHGQPLHLIHRDVSPQNLLVSFEGLVKLIDFGIAKAASKSTKTQSGVLKGKFGYMSPEQAANAYVDHRSDIFALGTVFWEMLTGRRLFHAESEFATLQLIGECDVVLPSKLNRNVPPEVDQIAMKSLEKDPEKRYHWAGEMVRDLRDFIMSCKPPFTQWHLQNWMCANFADELEQEWGKLPIFQGINTAEDVQRYRTEQREKDLAEQAQEFSQAAEDKESQETEGAESSELYSASFDFSDKESREPGRPKVHPPKPSLPPLPKLAPSLGKDTGAEDEVQGEDETPTQDFEALSAGAVQDDGGGQARGSGSNRAVRSVERSASMPRLEGVFAKEEESGVSDLVPEPVAPEVSDPRLVQLERAARRRITRRFLMISIAALLIMLCVLLVLMKTGFLKLGVPEPVLPSSASLKLEVVPVAPETQLTLYKYPSDDVPLNWLDNSPTAEFERLEAGRYIVEVAMPGYEKEKFLLNLDNANYEARLQMTKPVPELIEYTLNVPFEDAQVFVNNAPVLGSGLQRRLKGVLGQEYNVTVKKDGYEPHAQKIILGQEDTFNISLKPGTVHLLLESQPSAYVWVEGAKGMQRLGSTPYTITEVDPSQVLRVELRARSHETWSREIVFTDTFDRKFYVLLNKSY